MSVIYKTTCIINNKIYIGQSKHNRNWYIGSGKLLKKAIEKYGKESFVKEILVEGNLSQEELDHFEIKYILEFNSIDSEIGYNIEKGGYGNTEKQNIRISKSMKGRKLSEESRLKISNSKIGKKLSLETRKRISYSNKGNSNRKGIPHTEEDKVKVSNSLKIFYESEENRKKSSDAAKKRVEEGKCLEGIRIISSKENQIKATEQARLKNIKSVELSDVITNEIKIFESLIDLQIFFQLKGNSQLITCLKNEKLYKKRYKLKYNR
jgi:group I intron endonuclease